MELNEITSRLPPHLMQFVIEQPYYNYTSIDQAVWRYVMRKNYHHLRTVAHGSYVEGLRKTGISIEQIPTLYGMNRILKEIGWAAVAVDGFIPPAAFMEFQAYKVLVIAADIRTLAHIEYTPAPDIIHEAAGHAPIIADPEYSDFLIYFGKIGCKAFPSQKDQDLYEAIRHLSIIKEDPNTKPDEIINGELEIARIQASMGEPSEMALLRNLHWWSVEYGLIGTVEDYKLYGAGLLSSIGESVSCMRPEVKKLPFTLETAYYQYDITKPQPQLFVTPDFRHLRKVLDQFIQTMAISTGGLEGMKKAIRSASVSTCVYSSGIEVSGIFSEVLTDESNNLIYFYTSSPTSFSVYNKEIPGRYPHGYSAPVGRWRATTKNPETLSDAELEELGLKKGNNATLIFLSGIEVHGTINSIVRNNNGKLILIGFENGIVKYKRNILHNFSGDTYNMTVGGSIVSAYFGPADIEAYQPTSNVPREKMHKITYNASTLRLHTLYQKVREVRAEKINIAILPKVWELVKTYYPEDWLLSLEIFELLHHQKGYETISDMIKKYLENKAVTNPALTALINDGLKLI